MADLRQQLVELLGVMPGDSDDDTDAALLDAVGQWVPPTTTYMATEAEFVLPLDDDGCAVFVLRPMTHGEKRSFLAKQDTLRQKLIRVSGLASLIGELEKRIRDGDDVDARLDAAVTRVNSIQGVGQADVETLMLETVAPLVLRVRGLVCDGEAIPWPTEADAQADTLTRLGGAALKSIYDWTVAARGGVDERVRGK